LQGFFSCFAAACIFVLIQLATAVFYKLAFADKPVSFFGCAAYRTALLLLNTAVLPLPQLVA
jgi:hypothetical protein